jgi:hypothetical protein
MPGEPQRPQTILMVMMLLCYRSQDPITTLDLCSVTVARILSLHLVYARNIYTKMMVRTIMGLIFFVRQQVELFELIRSS